MRTESPYHEGEREIQERAGEAERGRRSGGVIADAIIPGALSFIEKQPMVVVGSVDPGGDVSASVLLGAPGFMRPVDPRTIQFDLATAYETPSDPLWANIEHDPRAGLLMIELATRRRLRVNGRLERVDEERLRLHVEQSYPNCPKYIQRRHLIGVTPEVGGASAGPRTGHSLDAALQGLIGAADTLFVASVAPAGGVDASHRGGNPGFVRVMNEHTLRIPDYPGNSMFNTLGNFALNPRAGLLFLDFERSRVLQLVGRPEIRWDLDEAPEETGGTGRYWDLEIERWLETPLPVRAEWEFFDYSPFNPGQAITAPRPEALAGGLR
jgi:predicted pyridoxine 5'-phosphate oxidase superfamily flavin-nucleotide-binding protein